MRPAGPCPWEPTGPDYHRALWRKKEGFRYGEHFKENPLGSVAGGARVGGPRGQLILLSGLLSTGCSVIETPLLPQEIMVVVSNY